MIDMQKYYMEKVGADSTPAVEPKKTVVPSNPASTREIEQVDKDQNQFMNNLKQNDAADKAAKAANRAEAKNPYEDELALNQGRVDAAKYRAANAAKNESWKDVVDKYIHRMGKVVPSADPLGLGHAMLTGDWDFWHTMPGEYMGEGADAFSALISGKNPFKAMWNSGNDANSRAATEAADALEKSRKALKKTKDKYDTNNNLTVKYGRSKANALQGVGPGGSPTLNSRLDHLMDWIGQNPMKSALGAYVLYSMFSGGGGYQMGPMQGYGMGPQGGGNIITNHPILSTAALGAAGLYGAGQGWFGRPVQDMVGGNPDMTEPVAKKTSPSDETAMNQTKARQSGLRDVEGYLNPTTATA